jgi:hypothetical protein
MVGVAQLAERLVVVQEVAGSTPVAHPHGAALAAANKGGRTGYPVRPPLLCPTKVRAGMLATPAPKPKDY